MTLPVGTPGAPVPATVRADGPDAVKTYQSAQGFERLLVERLASTLTEGTSLGEGPYAATLGQSFADGIVAGGGLGLTEDLYRSMRLGEGEAKP